MMIIELILTVLLDSKSHTTHHITIEKKQNTTDNQEDDPLQTNQIKTLLFGGNKDYDWMTSFLGLMDSIRFKPVVNGQTTETTSKELTTTQNLLKLITILTNIMVNNML